LSTELYCSLKDLHARHGAREFGKIVQKLLAIGFRLAGFDRVVERGVQGVDVDAVGDPGERYATEVRTTQKEAVPFAIKDIKGLAARQQDGYHPLLAVLRLAPLSDLFLVHTATLRCGRLQIASLRPYRFHELERRLQPCFIRAVLEHYEGALTGSQFYLDRVLREHGIEVSDLASSLSGGSTRERVKRGAFTEGGANKPLQQTGPALRLSEV
jgi:hypothetical protein